MKFGIGDLHTVPYEFRESGCRVDQGIFVGVNEHFSAVSVLCRLLWIAFDTEDIRESALRFAQSRENQRSISHFLLPSILSTSVVRFRCISVLDVCT